MRRALMVIWIALTWGGAASPAALKNGVLWEHKDGPFYSGQILWDRKELTVERLRSLYARLSKELKLERAWVVGIFVDKEDAGRELVGRPATEGNYATWLDLYENFGHNLLPMAELYGYGTNGVLRLRDESGHSSEVVLAGGNFLRARMQGIDYEVLKTYFSPLPPATVARAGDTARVAIYVRASSFPSDDQARVFSKLMRSRFQEKRIIVEFRTDSYFLTDGAFPVVYRFDPPTTPPTRDVYGQSRTLFCFCDRPEILCR